MTQKYKVRLRKQHYKYLVCERFFRGRKQIISAIIWKEYIEDKKTYQDLLNPMFAKDL